MIGSWSGDEITIVGDYADSGLYEIARKSYKNISDDAYNMLLEDDYLKETLVSKALELKRLL